MIFWPYGENSEIWKYFTRKNRKLDFAAVWWRSSAVPEVFLKLILQIYMGQFFRKTQKCVSKRDVDYVETV